VHLFDRSCAVTERQSCGPCGRVWRYGIADGVRASRFGDAALEGDDDIGCFVYADVDFIVDSGKPGTGRRSEYDSGSGTCENGDAVEYRADDGSAGSEVVSCSGEYSACATGSCTSAGEEVALKHAPNAEVAELADALA
jgi:hypothetical protein